ncbi:MAG TPA: hypothetical protein VGN73_15220 [Gemmatimonadaceae bacterium]|nr:hypothetical protein [Gemmatimonadaceae bacterium]
MNGKRVSLFKRLPEIYRIRDAEPLSHDQLRDYLALVEDAFGAIHENIEALYHDLFIEFCDEWAIPYIGDLLGTSPLSGDAWTLRADVADTIALRRRKGTLGAIELLTFNLTEWGVHCVELLENMVWNQHLNHQRPDDGGRPPYRDSRPGDLNPRMTLQTVIRGGTVTLRDPATLALLHTPFDPFAHVADVRPPANGSIRYNLPNLAIFLWRLAAYRIRVSRPVWKGTFPTTLAFPLAAQAVRFSINPVDRPYITAAHSRDREPVRLFNTNLVSINNTARTGIDKLNRSAATPSISRIDETPGPIPPDRLTSGAPGAVPEAYVSVETYDAQLADLTGLDLSDVGFQLHLPEAEFSGELFPLPGGQSPKWRIRGANLCNWETSLEPPLEEEEIAIDPIIGRLVIGVGATARANALEEDLRITYTYGAVGPVGAHPISYGPLPDELTIPEANVRRVNARVDANGLLKALKNIHQAGEPVVIEIQDSLTHVLDLSDALLTNETLIEGGSISLVLNRPLVIRAADNQRPIIELLQPLRFRPLNVVSPTNDPQEQHDFDAVMSTLTVRLEGLYLTRGITFPPDPGAHDQPLIARAALNSLEIISCTLDPAGYKSIHGDRQPTFVSMKLDDSYGFTKPKEESAFDQIPKIVLQKSIAGPLLIDSEYTLDLADSIVDAGQGVDDQVVKYAVTSASGDPAKGWGPPTRVSGVTFFGRTRVDWTRGAGGIWVHALEAHDNQKGCVKFSYFSGEAADRLPQNHGCVKGTNAALHFRSEIFGQPAYGQLTQSTDNRIRERGPHDDAMGAFGFLREAHKWRNLQIRFREFMPVGVRPLLISVT